jgi:hypothetical protein
MKNVRQLVLLGFLISFLITTVTYNSNYTFARTGNARFEIVDCPIEGDSTFQKSGPCPGPGSDSSPVNIKSESQNNMNNGIESGATPPSAVIASNPFASLS